VEAELAVLPRAATARASWRDFGAVILVDSLNQAPSLADRLAPEHLEIATGDSDTLAARIHDAGAIFIGRYTPEVIGDYVAGSNHVLPTARSARYASGLGVLDFMKRTSTLKLDADSLAALGPAAMALAEAEGLDAHRRSVAIRLNSKD
jgi:histidinol dehydrogenase